MKGFYACHCISGLKGKEVEYENLISSTMDVINEAKTLSSVEPNPINNEEEGYFFDDYDSACPFCNYMNCICD